MNDDIGKYLSGDKLYGDDFTNDEILEWFADETDGYANLGAKNILKYRYGYHCLNQFHGFKFIKNLRFNNALGIGSAYGDEFKPIAKNINKIFIIESSDEFLCSKKIVKTPCVYVKPSSYNNIDFEDKYFDLVTSFGVMHHIPNVSHMINECYRVLNKNGVMLLREPIVSMGDWRKRRPGLTKRERGIPLKILDEIIVNAKFKIINRAICHFPLIPRLSNKININAYNSIILTVVDAFLSKIFSWNINYHRTKLYEKFAPASVFYVLEK